MKLDKFIRIVLGLAIVVVFFIAIGALLFFTEAALNVWDRLLEGPRMLRWGYVGAMIGLVVLALYLIWLLLIRRSKQAKRKAAGIKLQELAEARSLKANEIGDAERLASQKLFQARQKMEATLLGEIRAKVVEIVTAKGFDMVFDKSFLPKASKAILYTSPRVTDLTDEVVAMLNAGVPAGN